MPKVSIIIPCYNQVEYLSDAINSIKKQTYKDYEVIIINDGSTELDAVEKINNFKCEKTIIIHDSNKGVAAARNTAIRLAKGQYILPLDADDAIDDRFLTEAVNILDAQPGIEVIRTYAQYFGINHEIEILPEYSKREHLLRNIFFNSSLFRKQKFLDIGGYDERFLIGWEDWDLYLRLINSESQVATIPAPYLFYRIKASSRNADLINKKKNFAEQQLYKKHLSTYLDYFPEPLSSLRDLEFLNNEKDMYEKYRFEIQNSLSYRLGRFLLYPFKLLIKFISQ